MAFKKEGAEFTDTVRFKDYALSFAVEEASRFSNEDGDVASAKVDFALSSAASLSASKHTAKIKELRRFLKSKMLQGIVEPVQRVEKMECSRAQQSLNGRKLRRAPG